MSKILDEIKKPILKELNSFEDKLKESMKSNVVLLDTIMNYIVQRKGKQIRPMFVFLTARLCGDVTQATYDAASLVELLHTATLVHDDVVDESYQRRGFLSINAVWKNKIAVLVGDYLLSKGLLLSVENGRFSMLQIVSNAVKDMSEGELLQIEKARRLDIKEEVYYEIIRQKTASLISSACACGAASSTNDEKVIQQAKLLGEKIGMAFQIKDDLFDYGDVEIGKPRGIDIKERKMTLPLIYTLNKCESNIKKKIINIVKNENEDKDKVREVIAYVKQYGGIEYTIQKMNDYKEEALKILDTFESNEASNSLRLLIDYTISREI
ncbi:MAG: polyprenyl synthetase family protein [Bacteroidota bacterium]